jgi:hypothetical protein
MTAIRASGALFALSALAAIIATPAQAEIYRPWCAQYYGANGGGTNCGFTSYQQCMMTAQGAGAWCVQNPWYLAYGGGQEAGTRGARARR